MSYDIQIWSVKAPELPGALPKSRKWRQEGDCWVQAAKDWQIVIGPVHSVLVEHVPEHMSRSLPGIRYLTEINLEPISAPKTGFDQLGRLSRALAKSFRGVIQDLQEGTISTPAGIKRYEAQKADERVSMLQLSWWFLEGPLLNRPGREEFVALLERMLPEAMPRRYGLYEPPPYVYAETGREHFLDFVNKNVDGFIVWYTHRPVSGVTLGIIPEWGPSRRGFRASYVGIGIEASALVQPGWQEALKAFWKAVSRVIGPFYGDVRILNGYLLRRGTCAVDAQTENHPVPGPWWAGLPGTLGQAVVLGEPYIGLWPDFARASEVEGGYRFLSVPDWHLKQDVTAITRGIPSLLVQRKKRAGLGEGIIPQDRAEYAEVWPFEYPYTQ